MIKRVCDQDQLTFKGAGGVQIIENEFECLVVRGGDSGHFAEKFVKKYCS